MESQLTNPLDEISKGVLKQALPDIIKDIIVRSNRVQLKVATGATTFQVQSSYMVITGAGAATIATIAGGREGMELILEFADTNITITDTGTGAADTVNLSAAFVSTANDILKLVYNGISWRESSRSVN